MTELELQELTDKIIAKLKADSLTIDQLTQTNVLTGMDFLELNSGRKVSLDDLRKFIRGYGIYLEIISKLDNETIPTDNNVFSSLRVLFEISKALEELKKIYLRKDQADGTNFLLKFGNFIDSMIAGKGAGIYPDGRGQFERLEVRGSARKKFLIEKVLGSQVLMLQVSAQHQRMMFHHARQVGPPVQRIESAETFRERGAYHSEPGRIAPPGQKVAGRHPDVVRKIQAGH